MRSLDDIIAALNPEWLICPCCDRWDVIEAYPYCFTHQCGPKFCLETIKTCVIGRAYDESQEAPCYGCGCIVGVSVNEHDVSATLRRGDYDPCPGGHDD